jgi:Ca2+-binding RTX toxin-like protein
MDPDPETFQLYDIAALQYIYGTNSTHNTGDNTYTSDMLDNRVLTIWDAGGNDRIDLSDLSHDAIVNLNEGAFSTVTTPDDYARGLYNIAIAFGTVIEDVTGSNFNDILIGNDVSNRIEGGAGSDELTGGAGADLFVYGVEWGNDTISDFVSGEDALDLTGSGLTREEIEITYGSTGATLSSSEGSIFMAGVTMIEEGDLFFDSLV